MIDAKDFIEKYERFYFKNIDLNNVNYDKEKGKLGLNTVKPVDPCIEDYIMDKKLRRGIYDVEAFAWKVGKIDCYSNNCIKYNHDSFTDSKIDYYATIRGKVNKEEFSKYTSYLSSINIDKDSILWTDISLWTIEQIEKIGWKEAYEIVAGDIFFSGFGPVNIINAMFFISKGKAPIYDIFAHKAVRALALEMNPADIYMGINPDKREVDNVIIMYKEYISLLIKLFRDEIKKDNMFISRDLDRALWVYGHATQKYEK